MDGSALVADLREDRQTELSRLGSDKYLVAATGADLATAPVLRVAARTAASGRETFTRWADEETGDVAGAFADAAETEADHYERIVDGLDERPGADPDDPIHAALIEQTATVERIAAGFVGRGLVCDRTTLQVVSFFVNEADATRADLFRDVRSSAQAHAETGATLLDARPAADSERARSAAETVIERAYADYAEALEAMGVDPKPVC